MILVISPHADDGIFSCGEFIARQVAQGEDVRVMSVCDSVPDRAAPSDRDWQERLNLEHEEACARLGAKPEWGGGIDGKWSPLLNQWPVASRIARYIDETSPAAVLIPMGIRHPDHLAVTEQALPACLICAAHYHSWLGRIAIYEELPYRILYPEEAHARRQSLIQRGWELEQTANAGYLADKLEACALYRSQWGDDIEEDARRCCAVPERIWWLS